MLIASENWVAPEDYKIYCYHGKATYIMLCVGRENKGNPQFFYFDRDWNLLMFNPDAKRNPDIEISKPKCLESMLHYAEILSEPFPFVRVDLYCEDDRVIFGELTFTPSGGMDTDNFDSADILMGSHLDLKRI